MFRTLGMIPSRVAVDYEQLMQPLDVPDTHDLVQVLFHPPESQQDAANAGCGPSRFFVGGGSSPGRAIRGDGAAGVRAGGDDLERYAGGSATIARVPQRLKPERAASPPAGVAVIPTSGSQGRGRHLGCDW
jgi:hypothetical protein